MSAPPVGSPAADTALARLRGPLPALPYDARRIAALTANPSCARRAVLDAAGVDKRSLAARVGFPTAYGRSPFAIQRGNAFAELVMANGCAELLTLLRAVLGTSVEEVALAQLRDAAGDTDIDARHAETLRVLRRVVEGVDPRTILDHPVLTLDIAGQRALLEPDAVTHLIDGRCYVVVIASFAAIDGQADPVKVAAAARRAAVHVLALRSTLTSLGHDPALVADRFLLVCPKNFSNRPFGRLVDVRQQLDAVAFQLARLHRVDALAATLAPGSFDLSERADGGPARSGAQLRAALSELPARFVPECLSACELAAMCREAATAAGEIARLGTVIRDDLPGIESITRAKRLIDGEAEPDETERDVVTSLRAAAALRARFLGRAS
jgi:hypothetical protein